MSKDNKNGWIKLHREFTKFEWYQDANTMRLFLHLLITANHKKAKWQGNVIDRGQLITSHANLANDLGLTIQNVRTSLLKLKKSENLTIKSTSKFTLLSVCNYDTYQSQDSPTNTPTNRRLTDDQQTTHNQLTTNKNNKEEKEEKEEGGEFVCFGIDVRTLNQKTQRGKQRTLEELKQVAQFKSQGYPVD
jgi:hypothetical protein